MDPDPQELTARAIAGDASAQRRLVDLLAPVIQARVARCLLRFRPSSDSRHVRGEVEDLTQEVFLALFANGGRVLAAWDPGKGMGLPGFVGLVAERQAISILRTGKRSPFTEEPVPEEELDAPSPAPDPEQVAASAERVRALLARLEERLSPLGRQLFDLLYVRELAPAEVSAATGLGADAVYAWRSRLRRLAAGLWTELESESAGAARRT